MTEYQKVPFIDPEERFSSNDQSQQSHKFHFNFGSLYIGVALLVVSFIYYVGATEGYSIRVMLSYAKLWPLMLILVGLSLYQSKDFRTAIFGIAMTVVAVGIAISSMLVVQDDSQFTSQFPVTATEDVKEANIFIENNAGKLTLLSSNNERQLFDGYFESNYVSLEPETDSEDGKFTISARQSDYWQGIGNYYKNFNARINSDVATNLVVSGVAMPSVLDLANINLKNLKLTVTASDVNLTLGTKSPDITRVSIQSNASRIRIFYPEELGVKILYNGNFSTTQFSTLLEKDPDESVLTTMNYNEKSNKVRITIDANLSDISLIQE